MEGSIRQKAFERLPSCIRKLERPCPKAYILLRLRKTEQHISAQLGIPIEDTIRVINEVRHQLAREGMLHLIEDPRMISLQGAGPPDADFPLADSTLGLDHRLIIKEFVGHLRDAVDRLSGSQKLYLRLRFRDGMSIRQIVDFVNRIVITPVQGEAAGGVKEQEIYTALNSALTAVLRSIKQRYGKETPIGLPGLKEILEEIEL